MIAKAFPSVFAVFGFGSFFAGKAVYRDIDIMIVLADAAVDSLVEYRDFLDCVRTLPLKGKLHPTILTLAEYRIEEHGKLAPLYPLYGHSGLT